MRSYWEIIGQAIREARQETEESQRNTALRLGMKPSDYSEMEDGKDNPDVILDALMRALVDRDKAREALRDWQTLRLWGAEPQHIHDFIKGQQVRVHEAQDIEKTCEQLERERDEAREALENNTASTIHTCHDKCKRPMCVLRRELVEARAELQRARVENNHLWQANEMAEQAFRERNAWRAMATELADAAAYGLAQWDDGYSPEVCRKIGETIMRFQKMQKEAELM